MPPLRRFYIDAQVFPYSTRSSVIHGMRSDLPFCTVAPGDFAPACWQSLRRLTAGDHPDAGGWPADVLAAARQWHLPLQRPAEQAPAPAAALEWLACQTLCAALAPQTRRRLQALRILGLTGSTNDHVRQLARTEKLHRAAVLAEAQSAGRGRHDRRWYSPLAANVYASVLVTTATLPDPLPPLSLIVGERLAHRLRALGMSAVSVKWPNDLWWHDRKLAGCLIELRTWGDGLEIVAGLGLNVAMPAAAAAAQVDQAWTDIRHMQPSGMPGRNALAALVLDVLTEVLVEQPAFDPAAYRHVDALTGRRVSVSGAGMQCAGDYQGVSSTGALRLSTPSGIRLFNAGEVSVSVRA